MPEIAMNSLTTGYWFKPTMSNEPTNPDNPHNPDFYFNLRRNSTLKGFISFLMPTLPDSCAQPYFLDDDEKQVCEFPISQYPKIEIIEQLKSYLFLEKDWDGYGGIGPAIEAVNDAIFTVKSIPDNLPLPTPMISGDGEVGVYWKFGNTFIDIEFSGDGLSTYYIRTHEGKEYFGDDISLSDSDFSTAIVNTLSQSE